MIEELAREARKILRKIPFFEQEKIDFDTYDNGDPVVFYEESKSGFYKVINERGNSRREYVAKTGDELISFFVEEAIKNFAFRYELTHRRKFESNLRQVDEIMQKCYNYIDPTKKFIKDSYDDEIHIYLDLFREYKRITKNFRKEQPIKYQNIKNDIDFIADGKYADSPYGGMSDVPKSMTMVRERIKTIVEICPELKNEFDAFEKYYEKLVNY
ncbi:MAG: hypothetical protein A2Y15_08075 [Clostridiales bacterium GWF2_36_10]|nr:MAG: hypothetical protein A2Y15_08075 [Clostridiales bacterium GWF2_36_10]HAN21839.1 hypothetical protein [Clostridiales bacterium]